jgi:cell division transport system ATP-binding protein
MKFILNTTVILLLLPHKQKLIMSQAVLSLITIYQEDNVILSNINLEVNHGEFLYIIGKTGSGKSSLMKTLYADLPLVEGEAHIVDFDLATLKENDIPF